MILGAPYKENVPWNTDTDGKPLDRRSTFMVKATGLKPVLHIILVMPEQNFRRPPPACPAVLVDYMKLAVPAGTTGLFSEVDGWIGN